MSSTDSDPLCIIIVINFQKTFVICSTKSKSINDTHREKPCFTQFNTRMAAWLLLSLSICLHNQLYSIHSIITYERVQMLENGDSSNRQ